MNPWYHYYSPSLEETLIGFTYWGYCWVGYGHEDHPDWTSVWIVPNTWTDEDWK